MKKYITITLILLATVLNSAVSQSIKKNDWTRDNLLGKVRSYSEIIYYAENRFGKIEKGKLKGENQSKYDEKGIKFYIYLDYPPLNLGEGRIRERLFDKKACKYDDKGNKIELNIYNSDGSLDSKETYKYDDKGIQIEGNNYLSDGSLDSKWTFKYDDKGNKIERNNYLSDGSLDSKETYKYDEKGNQIEENHYNLDGSLEDKWTYKYDDKGNLIESNHYNSDDGSLINKRTYGDRGNHIEQNTYNSDGSLNYKWTAKYEFDKQGNWIKKIESKNEIPETVSEREYEYYD